MSDRFLVITFDFFVGFLELLDRSCQRIIFFPERSDFYSQFLLLKLQPFVGLHQLINFAGRLALKGVSIINLLPQKENFIFEFGDDLFLLPGELVGADFN